MYFTRRREKDATGAEGHGVGGRRDIRDSHKYPKEERTKQA